MLAAVLALLQAVATPDLATIDQLPLAESAELALRGKAHGPIVAKLKAFPGEPSSPGDAVRRYLEAPIRLAGGCKRQSWRAEFRLLQWDGTVPYREERGDAVLSYVASQMEVALTSGADCPTDDYIFVYGDLEPSAAIDALQVVNRIRNRRLRVTFACSDFTLTQLCVDRRTILRELAVLKPDAISMIKNKIVIGFQGPKFTTVRFDPAVPDRIEISRSVPPVS